MDDRRPYHPPAYVISALTNVPKNGRIRLANLPTPIHRIKNVGSSSSHDTNANNGDDDDGILSRLRDLNVEFYVKRDDATGGTELGGNKVRKLEFLLADALASGCDSIVTIGGEQSNHCRATAAAR